ncbi:MAG: ABC transporter permease subunit [Ignavibacteria bacterium]|jgi:spermidine/putrescine transport system permease protein|nr:ABC transporter permease subunit [Ignavibacteria bacterium]
MEISTFLPTLTITISASLLAAMLATVAGFYLSYFAVFLRNKMGDAIVLISTIYLVLNPIVQFNAIAELFRETLHINPGNDYWLVIIALICRYFPIAFFITYTAIKRTNTSLIEISLDLGAKRFFIFWNIVVSDIKKYIYLALGFIFILCIGNVSTAIASGLRNTFYGSMVFNTFWNANTNIETIVLLLLPHLTLTIILFICYNAYISDNADKLKITGSGKISKYKCLTVGKEPSTLIISGLILLFITLVLLTIITSSIDTYSKVTFRHFENAFSNAELLDGMRTQFVIAVMASLIATIIGTALSLLTKRSKNTVKHYKTLLLPMLLSEMLFAAVLVSLMLLFGTNGHIGTPIVGMSLYLLIFASIFLASQARNMDRNLVSASVELGATYFQTLYKVVLPSFLPSVASCFFIMFAIGFNEWTLSYCLTKHDAILAESILEYAMVSAPELYAIGTLLLLITTLCIALANTSKIYSKPMNVAKYIVIALMVGVAGGMLLM